MLKYNPPDSFYIRFRSKIKKLVYIHTPSILLMGIFLIAGFFIKKWCNPVPPSFPGYYSFLVIVAYVPFIFFYRITRRFVNWRAFFFTLIITILLSIIWEVTLALPRGYWNYQHTRMLGIFITPWFNLPIEAVTVWFFCTLAILMYEFLKIYFFVKQKNEFLEKQQ